MDGKARVAVESAVHRTLHAHSFSRSSSQASVVLTDLLSRYLILLSSTCAEYAQHGGRINLTARDAFCALDELGVSMAELGEYCSSEGAELGRYTINTARRMEELKDFRVHLADGRRREREDQVPLVYAPLPDESDEEADEEDMVDVADLELQYPPESPLLNGTYAIPTNLSKESAPPRKRQRTTSWQPPFHIPHFLPALPADDSSADQPLSPQSPRMPPSQPPPLKIERPPSPLPQPSTPTYASDYFTSVPYDQSSLSSIPEWHLPTSRPPRISQTHAIRLPTPQTQPTLISAYHHILTRPPPPTASAANPSRHKVAMALLSLTRSSPRWEPPNTLYSSSAPCTPRVAVIGPTFPILIGETPQGSGDLKVADGERERKANLPSLPPRAVFLNERITPLITQQPSRIPELARHVLPGSVHNRTTRLNHPPPLFRESRGGQESQRLLYGSGVNAPWNSNIGPPAVASTPTTAKLKDVSAPNGLTNGKESLTRTIPDARLHATWDYEAKRYNEVLPIGRRARLNSMSGLTLSLGGRS